LKKTKVRGIWRTLIFTLQNPKVGIWCYEYRLAQKIRRVGKKLLGCKILSVMKLEAENWSVVWSLTLPFLTGQDRITVDKKNGRILLQFIF
jgi:hypothetical protein